MKFICSGARKCPSINCSMGQPHVRREFCHEVRKCLRIPHLRLVACIPMGAEHFFMHVVAGIIDDEGTVLMPEGSTIELPGEIDGA